MKDVIVWLTPWIAVAIAAVIWAFFFTPSMADYWETLKHSFAAMMIGAIVLQFGEGIAKGIKEGLEKPRTPGP